MAVLVALLVGLLLGVVLRPVLDAYIHWKTAEHYATRSAAALGDEDRAASYGLDDRPR
jgi:hypothetical protein